MICPLSKTHLHFIHLKNQATKKGRKGAEFFQNHEIWAKTRKGRRNIELENSFDGTGINGSLVWKLRGTHRQASPGDPDRRYSECGFMLAVWPRDVCVLTSALRIVETFATDCVRSVAEYL